MSARIAYLTDGSWHTIETFWNVHAVLFFLEPAGAHIKVRYGFGVVGWSSQCQTLNGNDVKVLEIANISFCGARVQIWVPFPMSVTYQFSLSD